VRRRLASVIALGAISLFALPGAAEGYAVGGKPWPAAAITYYVAAKGYAAPVERAARIWNGASVGARLVRTSRAKADVVVSYGGRRCEGLSPMGFGGWRASTVMRLGAGCSTGLITLTAVHEFGHVLGLDHENSKCARMNASFSTTGSPTHCMGHSLGYWLKRPLEPDDIRGARALYERG
jgi:Matrixin